MHPHVIARLNALRKVFSGAERDMHLRPVLQQQSIDVTTGVQQIAINDPISHGRPFHGGRIEDQDRNSVTCSLWVFQREEWMGKRFSRANRHYPGEECRLESYRCHVITGSPRMIVDRPSFYFERNPTQHSRADLAGHPMRGGLLKKSVKERSQEEWLKGITTGAKGTRTLRLLGN